MYKLLLCWRYLKTRYLAFACIISVMLGVATLIVVNSVMNGFSTKLKTLLHGVLSDVVMEGHSMEGFYDPVGKIARIRKDPYLHARIESMAITLESFAMVQYRNINGEVATRPVRVMGVELKSRSEVGGFHEHLASYRDAVAQGRPAPAPSFQLPDAIRRHFADGEQRLMLHREQEHQEALRRFQEAKDRQMPLRVIEPIPGIDPEVQKFMAGLERGKPAAAPVPPPMAVPHAPRLPSGVIVGHLIAHFKYTDPKTKELKEAQSIQLGHSIVLTTVSGGEKLMPVYDSFVVVDYFQSQMSEYDANCVFIPLEHLQTLRSMDNRASNILIKLKNYQEAKNVVDALSVLFEDDKLGIHTWEEKQGPLLKAIEIDRKSVV